MINLTDSALAEIKRLMAEKEITDARVRFGVETGGCSGLQYSMDFDRQTTDQDHLFAYDDLQVVCDQESLAYIDGLVVDYSDKLMGGGFKFRNPNAIRGAVGIAHVYRIHENICHVN
jgi:iron-sulfur cluster assembly protein